MPTNRSITPELIELTIDSLSYNGGRGVGRFDGLVVFVANTAPGDHIRARVTQKKSRFWQAELVDVLTASALRRVPPCPVAGVCGGCSWQHVNYVTQVEQKNAILKSSLRPLERFGNWEWRPFLAADQEFHYRNRIQLQVQAAKLGFFAARSHRLVTFDKCWIAEEPINQALAELRADPAIFSGVNKIELALDEDLNVRTVHGRAPAEFALFAQVNRAQNEKLKGQVVDEARGREFDWGLDLYAGSGNLAFPLLAHVAKMKAVELSRTSVERGRQNLSAPTLTWEVGDVAQVLRRLPVENGKGLIVLDPPRTGCAPEVLPEILRHRPAHLIYVSCNPTTFARDAQALLSSGTYRLTSVQGVDLFPQTEHVELVAHLCVAN